MKKTFIFLLFLCFSAGLRAQTVFNAEHLAMAGDSFLVSVDNSLPLGGYDFDTSGTGFLWHYDRLDPVSQSFTRHEDPAGTGYRPLLCFGSCVSKWDSLTNAILLKDTLDLFVAKLYDMYNFYANTGSRYELKMLGFKTKIAGIPLQMKINYNTPDVLYEFPVAYGDDYTSASSYAINVPGAFIYKHQQYRHSVVDGWGTLTTPYGTIPNTVRIKSVIDVNDTLILTTSGDTLPLPMDTVVEYRWLTSKLGQPVLTVKAILVQGRLIYTQAVFLDSIRCLDPIALAGYLPVPTYLNTDNDSVEVHFLNVSVNADSVHWNFGDAAKGPDSISNRHNPTHWYTSAGVFLTELSVCNTSPACPSLLCDTFLVPVVVLDSLKPVALFMASPANPCPGDTVSFMNLSVKDSSWFWHFADSQSGTADTSSREHPRHAFASPGDYEVRLIVMNGSELDTFKLTLSVQEPPVADFLWSDTITKAPVLLKSTSSGITEKTSYLWTIAGAKPDALVSVNDSVSVLFNKQDTTTVSLMVWNALSCPSIKKEKIFIYDCLSPKFSTGGLGNTFCVEQSIYLTNKTTSSLPDAIQYNWLIDMNLYSQATDTTAMFEQAGGHEVALASDNGRCRDTSVVNVLIRSHAEIYSAGADATLCADDTISLVPDFTTGGQTSVTYKWSPAAGLNKTNVASVLAFPTTTTEYIFKLSVLTGVCDALKSFQDTLRVVVTDGDEQADFNNAVSDSAVLFFSTGELVTTWFWDFGDGSTDSVKDPWHRYDSAGVYDVCLSTESVCGIGYFCDSVSVIVTNAATLASEIQHGLYPNPFSEVVFLELTGVKSDKWLLDICNINGQCVLQRAFSGGQTVTFNKGFLPTGVYVYTLSSNGGAYLTGRLIAR